MVLHQHNTVLGTKTEKPRNMTKKSGILFSIRNFMWLCMCVFHRTLNFVHVLLCNLRLKKMCLWNYDLWYGFDFAMVAIEHFHSREENCISSWQQTSFQRRMCYSCKPTPAWDILYDINSSVPRIRRKVIFVIMSWCQESLLKPGIVITWIGSLPCSLGIILINSWKTPRKLNLGLEGL